jgi:hypothetical protein
VVQYRLNPHFQGGVVPSFRSEKRLKELARAKKREEKRQKKLARKAGTDPDAPQEGETVEAAGELPEEKEPVTP